MSESWKQKPYKGHKIKLKNRRVEGYRTRDGKCIYLRWKNLHGNIPIRTDVLLSNEAAEATLKILIRLVSDALKEWDLE